MLGELLRWKEAHHPEAHLWFYRDKEGLEVDFVVDVGGELTLLDAKLAEVPAESDARSLFATAARLGGVASKALVTPSRTSFPIGKAVRVVSGFRLAADLGAAPSGAPPRAP